jgi:uncharacterized coiled-coil protein SlyX
MKEENGDGNGNGNGRLFRFNREITLGNLLQLGSFVVALVAMWTSMDKRLTAVELRESFAVEERRDLKKSLATLVENQAVLARTVDRMSIVLDERIKEARPQIGGAK